MMLAIHVQQSVITSRLTPSGRHSQKVYMYVPKKRSTEFHTNQLWRMFPSLPRNGSRMLGWRVKKRNVKWNKEFDLARDDLRGLVDPDRLPSTCAAYCHAVTEPDQKAKSQSRQLIPHRPSLLQMAAKSEQQLSSLRHLSCSSYSVGLGR